MNAKKQFVDSDLRNRRTGISLLACVIAGVAGLAALATPPAQAQTYQVLYTFTGGIDGSSPSGVILDRPAIFMEQVGGGHYANCGCGVVFKLVP